jgi:hypothetical protein
MTMLSQPNDRYELELIEQVVVGVLNDSDIIATRSDVKMYRNEFVRGLAIQLRTYMLSDHLEHQTVQYVETTLPHWLRWLRRFVVEKTYELKLDAYYAYPQSRIAIPDLGQARRVITFSKYQIPDNLQ